MNPLIKTELDSLQLQFGNKALLTLDEYAALYSIGRRNASIHLHRKGIPASKEGGELFISMVDLATYKAQRKLGRGQPTIVQSENVEDMMKRRRGFSRQSDRLTWNVQKEGASK